MTRVAVIGSAGRTGRRVVAAAIAKGWIATGLQHQPAAGLPVVVGDASDPGTVADAVRDADLVVCALGGDADGCLRATRVLVDVLRERGPRRIIAITGAMVGHPPEQLPWLYRAIRRGLRGQLEPRREQERLIRESGLDWTIVRPPRLTDRRPRGEVVAADDIPIRLFDDLSRDTLADFLVGDGAGPRYIRRSVALVERR